MEEAHLHNGGSAAPSLRSASEGSQPQRKVAFGTPRDFLDNRYVYLVVSERAHGLSVGVNMNPDKLCDFDCCYCEVDRRARPADPELDVEQMAGELQATLQMIAREELRLLPRYAGLDPELRRLKHVTLSGDGEPTLSPRFTEAIQAIVHLRALGNLPFFKLVLITNASGLHREEVLAGLKLLTKQDEIWAKLDGGTQTSMNRVNRSKVPLGRLLQNILTLARQRPVIIQSMFPEIHGERPSEEEIEQYALRLKELREHGAQIPLVQIYSATRPIVHPECTHLPLKVLSKIAHQVREVSGLTAEVF